MKQRFKQRYKFLFIFLVIFIAVILRFYQLDKIPPGLLLDEASEGYNAFSLLHTGKDRYGESFPILFRSFGSYQAPLYTYLTIIPVYFFKNSIFSIHLVSAVSGVLLVIITIIFFNFKQKNKTGFQLMEPVLVAISPWAVFFSRIGTEASLGVTLFVLSFLLFYLSLKRLFIFPIAAFILGLSTHAYYSERLTSVLFLTGFFILFRKILFANKKILFLGLIVFGITQLPHLFILSSGAFTRRLTQIDYVSEQYFQGNSGMFHYIPFGRLIFIIREFLSHYLSYFSPRNLFFDPDPQGARSIPDISVFFGWMLIPFIFGLRWLFYNRSAPLIRMIILLVIISPIPASLTRDPFSSIRTLTFLWGMTLIIAFGANELLKYFSSIKFKALIFIIVISLSLAQLYLTYFVLLKYERFENYGSSYLELLNKIAYMKNNRFVVDSSRELGTGIRFAYLMEYNPQSLQKTLGSQIKNKYYSSFEYDEPYIMDNIEARPIIWREDICKKQILVGDLLAISGEQVSKHNLLWLFDIKDMAGNVALKAYSTNPDLKCNLSVRRET